MYGTTGPLSKYFITKLPSEIFPCPNREHFLNMCYSSSDLLYYYLVQHVVGRDMGVRYVDTTYVSDDYTYPPNQYDKLQIYDNICEDFRKDIYEKIIYRNISNTEYSTNSKNFIDCIIQRNTKRNSFTKNDIIYAPYNLLVFAVYDINEFLDNLQNDSWYMSNTETSEMRKRGITEFGICVIKKYEAGNTTQLVEDEYALYEINTQSGLNIALIERHNRSVT